MFCFFAGSKQDRKAERGFWDVGKDLVANAGGEAEK